MLVGEVGVEVVAGVVVVAGLCENVSCAASAGVQIVVVLVVVVDVGGGELVLSREGLFEEVVVVVVGYVAVQEIQNSFLMWLGIGGWREVDLG